MRPQQAAEQFNSLSAAETRALRLCLQISVISLIWAVGLVTLGAVVSATDSAGQCSGWPLCNGRLSPASDINGTLIFSHRLGGFAILLLAAALVAITQLQLRFNPAISRLAAGIFVIVLGQSVMGGLAVVRDLPNAVVTAHLVLAMAVIAALSAMVVLIWSRLASANRPSAGLTLAAPAWISGYARAMAIVLLALLVSASIVDSPASGPACGSAGDCAERLRGAFGAAGGLPSLHYMLGIVGFTLAAAFLRDLYRDHETRGLSRQISIVAGATLGVAVVAGAIVSLVTVPDAALAAPLAVASVSWLATVALVTGAYVSPGLVSSPVLPRAYGREMLRDFARVTKPGIMLLLLVTTLGAMLIAAQGWPSLQLVLLTLLGGALASGGASALNCYYDRDIDGVMARTRKRPIPTGGLTPDQVRAFGLTLSVLAVIELAWLVNPLAAMMALAGNLFYVLVYTRKLKRSTPQNIVIGGAAGSFPPLVGWAAVTGSLSLGAFLIAAIIFYWTPPHFWSLALLKANDYKRAGIPMLPVTHGDDETRRRILLYSFLLVSITLLMVPAGVVGMLYGVIAALLGSWFIIMALRMFREGTSRLAWPLFKYSNYYLAALLAAMAIDHGFRL